MRFKIISLSFLVIAGITLILQGSITIINNYKFNNSSVHTKGTFLYYHPELKMPDSIWLSMGMPLTYILSGEKNFYANIRFTTKDNKTFRFQSPKKNSVPLSQEPEILKYKLGDQVKIMYNPKNPNDARIAEEVTDYGNSIYTIITGICFLIFAFLLYSNITKPRIKYH